MKIKTLVLGATTALLIGVGGSYLTSHTFSAQAVAQSSAKATVDAAISRGLVGETSAGYLALVSGSAPQDVVNAMNEINSSRKSLYTSLARQQNVAVTVVAALTGEKQIAKTARGTRYKNASGKWVTK